MAKPTELTEPFDPELAVTEYRNSIARRDAARTDKSRAKHQALANRLREKWKDWQGEDSLHEMAFGEFID